MLYPYLMSIFRKAISLFLAGAMVFSSFDGYALSSDAINYNGRDKSRPYTNLLGVSQVREPVLLKGIKINSKDPFRLDFILEQNRVNYTDAQFKEESARLVRYFLAALTVPAKDLWVNLSPYEKEHIVPDALGATDFGRDLLSEDYVLKHLAASLTYPETEIGKAYWDEINNSNRSLSEPRPSIHSAVRRDTQGAARIETTQSFNKIWIVPGKATIVQNGNEAVVKEATVKVMCEEDYLAVDKNNSVIASAAKQSQLKIATVGNNLPRNNTTNAFKTHILPLIEQDVNHGTNFAQLRQMYNALILAVWFKKKLRDSIFGKVYLDKNKTAGIEHGDLQAKEKIYRQYLKAFEQGAYNYVKSERVETQHFASLQKITRRQYFSGGADWSAAEKTIAIEDGNLMSIRRDLRRVAILAIGLSALFGRDSVLKPDSHNVGNNEPQPLAVVVRSVEATGLGNDGGMVSLLGLQTIDGNSLLVEPVNLASGGSVDAVLMGHSHADVPYALAMNRLIFSNPINIETATSQVKAAYYQQVMLLYSKIKPTVASYRRNIPLIKKIITKHNIKAIGLEESPEELSRVPQDMAHDYTRVINFFKAIGMDNYPQAADDFFLAFYAPVWYLARAEDPAMQGVKIFALESMAVRVQRLESVKAIEFSMGALYNYCRSNNIDAALFSNIKNLVDRVMRDNIFVSGQELKENIGLLPDARSQGLAWNVIESCKGFLANVKQGDLLVAQNIAAQAQSIVARDSPSNVMALIGKNHLPTIHAGLQAINQKKVPARMDYAATKGKFHSEIAKKNIDEETIELVPGKVDADILAKKLLDTGVAEKKELRVTIGEEKIRLSMVIDKNYPLSAEVFETMIADIVKNHGGDITRLKKGFVVTYVDSSKTLGENHTDDRIVGINRAVNEIKDEEARAVVSAVLAFHELCHELIGKNDVEFEKEQFKRDMRYVWQLCWERNIELRRFIVALEDQDGFDASAMIKAAKQLDGAFDTLDTTGGVDWRKDFVGVEDSGKSSPSFNISIDPETFRGFTFQIVGFDR